MAVPWIGPKIASKLNDMLMKHTQLHSSYKDVVSNKSNRTSQTTSLCRFFSELLNFPWIILSSTHFTVGKQSKRKKPQPQCENQKHEQISSSEGLAMSINGKKSYIPKPRSGPWALLVALYRASLSLPNFCGSLSKAELIHLAQPLCDSSFFQVSTLLL
jgi:hypothetical protein